VTNIWTAPPEAVAAGTQIAFVVAAALIVIAIAGASQFLSRRAISPNPSRRKGMIRSEIDRQAQWSGRTYRRADIMEASTQHNEATSSTNEAPPTKAPPVRQTMKAVIQNKYGSADTLELSDIDMPVVGDDEVLVRVHAASIHIGDWHVMTGLPYMLRIVGFGLLAPKIRVRGMDVAGTVERVGRNVTQFQLGDEVFGTCNGAFAQYACAGQDKLAHKPANLTFEQAAAVPTSGYAALQGLRDKGEIRAGQNVLIIGASGGVGSFAVQIAKSFGAEVTGVCSTRNMERVRAIGADHVIDYTQEDFTRGERRYDLILETGGRRSLSDIRRAMRPAGILVLVGGEGGSRWIGGTDRWIQALLLSPFVSQKLRPLASMERKEDLSLLKDLIEANKVVPSIDRTYSLSEVPDAMRHIESGRARGKVVVTV
jgi:NADPH:quinone reductase-like Zn-dependent oxidoreductase